LGVFTEKDEKGAKISRVNEKSGAEKAGLKEGDIITHVNSTPIAGPEELSEAIRKNKIDDEVSITYLRNGKTQKVKATLGKSNEAYVFNTDEFNFNFEDGKPYAFTIPRPSMPRAPFWNEDGIGQFFIQGNDRPRYGMQIQDDEDRRGVEVTEVEDDSNADKGGLKEGDIIEAIDGEKITDVDSFREKLTAKKDNPSVSLKILREGKSETLTIKVPRKLKSASL
ncbi:MAG: PDZ domain-containing protein, partial [Chitinophagaceae bacterium]|nr:PDZ domain-containing protein [Chitinophagaceae bacterium]